jgi:hypothetical protein
MTEQEQSWMSEDWLKAHVGRGINEGREADEQFYELALSRTRGEYERLLGVQKEHAARATSMMQDMDRKVREGIEFFTSFAYGIPMPNGLYAHLLTCSGSRAVPRGTPGNSCSCLGTLNKELS